MSGGGRKRRYRHKNETPKRDQEEGKESCFVYLSCDRCGSAFKGVFPLQEKKVEEKEMSLCLEARFEPTNVIPALPQCFVPSVAL